MSIFRGMSYIFGRNSPFDHYSNLIPRSNPLVQGAIAFWMFLDGQAVLLGRGLLGRERTYCLRFLRIALFSDSTKFVVCLGFATLGPMARNGSGSPIQKAIKPPPNPGIDSGAVPQADRYLWMPGLIMSIVAHPISFSDLELNPPMIERDRCFTEN